MSTEAGEVQLLLIIELALLTNNILPRPHL
jgi:hypothetical protein